MNICERQIEDGSILLQSVDATPTASASASGSASVSAMAVESVQVLHDINWPRETRVTVRIVEDPLPPISSGSPPFTFHFGTFFRTAACLLSSVRFSFDFTCSYAV